MSKSILSVAVVVLLAGQASAQNCGYAGQFKAQSYYQAPALQAQVLPVPYLLYTQPGPPTLQLQVQGGYQYQAGGAQFLIQPGYAAQQQSLDLKAALKQAAKEVAQEQAAAGPKGKSLKIERTRVR